MANRNERWQAHWIWAVGDNFAYRRLTNSYVFCRTQLELPEAPVSARVRVTADTRFRMWVNGELVLNGPARGYPHSWPYDEIDLQPWLDAGENVIGILAHCVGDFTFQSEFAGRAGVLLDGEVKLRNGQGIRLDTHPEIWTAKEADCYERNVHRFSVQTGWQECCDLRRWPFGWLDPGQPEGFVRPADMGPHPQAPWLALEPRGIPLLDVGERLPREAVGSYTAAAADGWSRTDDLSQPLTTEDWQPAPGVLLVDGDKYTLAVPEGQAAAVVFDLGLTCIGYPEVPVLKAAGGTIDVAYAERRLPSGFIATRPPEWTQPRHVDRFLLRPGSQMLEVFNPRGYRYLAVIVRGTTEPVTFRAPRLREISYPGHAKGKLKTGDAQLDAIWQIGSTTLRRNMTDAYTDCPWREQAQWWGDARVEFLINAYTLGDTALLARGIRQCAQSMQSDGLMHGVFPGRGPILPDYNFVWVETLWDHYWHTGSDVLLRRHADDLRRNLAWFRDQTDSSGLLAPPDGKWLFLDWATLYRGRYSTVYNLRYVQALSTAARIFNQLGDSLEADACLGRGMLTALALTQRVFDPETGLWHDGFDPERGERIEQVSVHAQALAILLGLEPHTHDHLCREILIPAMLEDRTDVVAPSPFFSAFVLQALLERGFIDDVLAIIRKRWGAWLADGHPTWPEEWDPQRQYNLSLCHAWSGAPTYLLSQMLLGVEPTAPGWRRIRFAPRRGDLTEVSGVVPVPQGEVAVSWRVQNGTWTVRAVLPENVEADVDLGDGEAREAGPGVNVWEVAV